MINNACIVYLYQLMATRLQIAKADIVGHFDQLPKRPLQHVDIDRILTDKRAFWRLAQRTGTRDFVEFLKKFGRLKVFSFPFPAGHIHRYTWGDVPLMTVIQSLKPRSYLSHYTALRFHGLTEQIPKTVFLTHEPAQKPVRFRTALTQAAIDGAFAKPERVSAGGAVFEDITVCLVSAATIGHIGVMDVQLPSNDGVGTFGVPMTGLERTLIDCTIRPAYAGGVAEVLKAFQEAKGRASVNRLRALLQKMEFMYPYHQAIGFYLQRAGYKDLAIDLFRKMPQEFDFYLSHGMRETEFVPEWRLFIPKGL